MLNLFKQKKYLMTIFILIIILLILITVKFVPWYLTNTSYSVSTVEKTSMSNTTTVQTQTSNSVNEHMSSASSSKLKITIVYDNYLCDSRLETAWGFASVIQGLNKSILFDTGGNGSILLSNMHQMKINPAEIDVVVISHIHHDHVGGLSEFLKVNPNVAVYLPKSFPESVKTMVRESGAQPIEVNKEIEICETCYSNGELGTTIKEQSLIIKSDKGLIIITGCAHPGIVNIVKKAKDRFKDDVFLALGGFHLSGLTENQLDQVIKEIKLQGVEMIGPCHCSGDTARRLLEEEYGTNYLPAGVGMQLDLEMVT